LIAASHLSASTITFEGFVDSTNLTNQVPGVVLANAIVLSAGNSLNEFEFPPRSGVNVISDSGSPLQIQFFSSQSAFTAYVTYLQPLAIQAFDAGSNLIGSIGTRAGCTSNLALSGTPTCLPNELIQLTGVGAISRVTISGDPSGGSFVLDDLGLETSGVPEPATFALAATAMLAFCLRRFRLK